MRLIDADAMRNDWLENGENEYVYDTNAMLDSIDAQPTIDAVPVVHGRWIPTYHKYYNRDGECLIADEWHCSECGVRHRDKWNYCPNCGAKMDGEADA